MDLKFVDAKMEHVQKRYYSEISTLRDLVKTDHCFLRSLIKGTSGKIFSKQQLRRGLSIKTKNPLAIFS